MTVQSNKSRKFKVNESCSVLYKKRKLVKDQKMIRAVGYTITMLIAHLIRYVIICSYITDQQLVRPVEVYKRVIEDIHLVFNNTCIIFLHTDDHPTKCQEPTNSLNLKILQEYFSNSFVRTAVMDLKTFETQVGSAYFHLKRPLFILLNDFEKLKHQFSHGIATWITMAYPTWLMFMRKETKISDFLSEIFVPFNCIFLITQQAENDTSEVITEAYQIDRNTELRTAVFGYWSFEKGLSITKLSLYQRRGDLFGQEIKVVVIEDPPLSVIVRNSNGEMVDLTGFFGTILKIIEKSMNCTFTFIESTAWGTISENGSSTGLVEMLINKKADLAAVGLTMTTNRLNQIAFTTPVYTSRCRTYIKKPTYAAIKWKAFFAPFELGIWGSLVVLIVISSVAILVARSLVKMLDDEQEQLDTSPLTFVDTALLVYGAFCSQGIEQVFIDSVRIIHVIIHMTGVIILSAYSAALISFLAVKVFVMPFTTMDGLLSDGTYQFAVVGESSDYELFQNTTDKTLKQMFEQALDQNQPLPVNYFEGLKRVCGKEKYSFMTFDNIVAVLTSKLNCTLEPLDVIMQTTNAMAVQLRSPYQGIINSNILMMKDSGIMQRLFANEWSQELKKNKNEWVSVDIKDILPLILVLAIGFTCGVMFLCFEHIFTKIVHAELARLKLKSKIKKLNNIISCNK